MGVRSILILEKNVFLEQLSDHIRFNFASTVCRSWKMNCGCLHYHKKVSLHQGAGGEFVIKLWKGVAVG